ncbi:heparinase II/III family protein [Blastochloris sulfoviridis]|uniref:Heparinase n=1 Tax=Blastochloris sulfoviridis TaxID=50712 RepID=A0A5M6I2U7_9HYPH|nr:alginate lyase family protein [Blastochloris sulfoviridis]KAA5602530.1 heparinase [Blastochloris sulfoviridis]
MQHLASAARLVRTVRHLKPVQVYARARLLLPRGWPEDRPAPALRPVRVTFVAPTLQVRSLLGRWRVRFLNREGEIAQPPQWNDKAQTKLWLYNLHYFDDLCGPPADAAHRALQRDVINRWIAENPPGAGNGWEPYPVSLRIVNWIKWALAGESLEPHWRDSLAMQVRWLSEHIEWHLLGNHLLANAKALVFAGLFFNGAEADQWLARGLSILRRELPEQILPDGGHFELSPMYHAIILEDVLDLINIGRTFGRGDAKVFRNLPDIAARMRSWLAAMTHPDGGPAFFNDAAFGVAASRADLEAYAGRLGLGAVEEPGEGVQHLAASGYVRVNRGDMAAILDLAAVGPGYIPGHAHADTLSFELSLGCERIVVNGGTSTYTPGALREAQRSTAAHSTVEVEGENSSEVWASFRVARRARVQDVRIEAAGGTIRVSAAHDGYRHLLGRPACRRTWQFEGASLVVADEVACLLSKKAVARFHLGPGVAAESDADRRSGRLQSEGGRVVNWSASSEACIAHSPWFPEFGRSVSTDTLVVPLSAGQLVTRFAWARPSV